MKRYSFNLPSVSRDEDVLEEPLLEVVVLAASADDLLPDQFLSGNDDVSPDVHLLKEKFTAFG
jgi:hypothetical protein